MYDVIIIGKGPAGISAALYTKRGNLSTLVIGKDKGALGKAKKIENYYGITNSGEKIFEEGIKQAQKLQIEIKTEEVLSIELANKFIVTTNKKKYESKTILLATGTNRKVLPINGIKEFEGKGISYCTICDGFFYKNKNVAVIGNGEYAIHEAIELSKIVNSVTILTNGREILEFPPNNIKINKTKIQKIIGENTIKGVKFIDNSEQQVEGIFIAEGTATSTDFAKKLGAKTENEKIFVNENMETNIKGLYAAGDCTGGLLQISKAVYEGAKAGLEIIKYFR